MRAGDVERRELEYIRHGTQTLIGGSSGSRFWRAKSFVEATSTSTDDLVSKLTAFIEYFNRTMAKRLSKKVVSQAFPSCWIKSLSASPNHT